MPTSGRNAALANLGATAREQAQSTRALVTQAVNGQRSAERMLQLVPEVRLVR